MKVSEFEAKLTTVSDSKLRRMLAESREKGPEVAVNLILAEAGRRGMDTSGTAVEGAPLTDAVPADGIPLDETMPPAEGSEAPAVAGAWLHEEANRGMPVIAKVLIAVVVLGGILGGLFFLLNKGS